MKLQLTKPEKSFLLNKVKRELELYHEGYNPMNKKRVGMLIDLRTKLTKKVINEKV